MLAWDVRAIVEVMNWWLREPSEITAEEILAIIARQHLVGDKKKRIAVYQWFSAENAPYICAYWLTERSDVKHNIKIYKARL